MITNACLLRQQTEREARRVAQKRGELVDTARSATIAQEEAERENRALKQQVVDLSRQVQVLLRNQYERAINAPISSKKDGDSSSLAAHGVITEKLVTIEDIDDMQRNNQALIATVRALTDELEKKGTLNLNRKARG